MSHKKILTWGDVAYTARMATFGLNEEWQALEWIWQTWEILIQLNLTMYSNNLELCHVVIRFLVIVSFFFECCENYHWEYYVESYVLKFIENINISNSSKKDIICYLSSWNYSIDLDNENEIDSSLLLYLARNARQEVLKPLIRKFGSESMLFKYIHEMSENAIEEYELDKEYEYSFCRSEAEIISEVLITEKILADMVDIAKRYEALEEDDQWLLDQPVTEIIFQHPLQKNIDYSVELPKAIDTNSRETDVMLAAKKLADFFSCYELKPKYTLCKCAEDTCLNEAELKRWIRAINRKGQAILYGSPGTGKTFIAEKLAQHLIGGGNGFSELVQFHPAYSYEDFIQGIRPQNEDGKLSYPLVPGRFVQFCKEAENRQGICVFIIDEINRANLAQVFGELMYLLEYRDKEIPLAGGNKFRIPANVRIIGTMNTADRSIALVDYALRRRFAFIELRPNYDLLRRYHQKTGLVVEGLIQTLQRLNQTINDKNYEIGISFFLTDKLSEDIEDIWCMEIEPYLEEYFFNQLEKVNEFRWEKVKQQLSL